MARTEWGGVVRNISFSLTTRQFLDGAKTVTRRLGWKNLKPGDRLMAVKKGMGLKPGEKIERLGEIEVVHVSRLLLGEIMAEDCAAEGFPELPPAQFVAMFCRHMGCTPTTEITRIEFRRVP